jgi:predicted enzyme related to lactoylglutathione lyase
MNKRVTGIGGIFFKAEDPKKMNEWYAKHLGVQMVFKWKELDHDEKAAPAQTIWSPFKANTQYFAPSDKPFMINYRVENLAELLDALSKEGIQKVGGIEEHPYGKFAWIMDPEGHKIELWEPIDDDVEEEK